MQILRIESGRKEFMGIPISVVKVTYQVALSLVYWNEVHHIQRLHLTVVLNVTNI